MANTASRRTCCIPLVLPLLLLAQQGTALGSDWMITPKLSVGERYSDNVNLNRKEQAQSDWITEISPGITVVREGRRLTVNADYSLLGLIYAQDNDRSRARHNLNGRAHAELIDDWLYLDATARVSQELLDYTYGRGLGDAVGIGNTSQVAGYGLTPYVKHRFGSLATVEMRLSQEGVTSSGSTGNDSSSTGYQFRANSGNDFFPLSWEINYNRRETDNRRVQDTDSEHGLASARLQLSRGFGLLAQAGVDRNNYPGATSRIRDYSYYGLGFFYTPGRRFSVDLYYNDSDSGGFVSGSVSFNPTLRTSLRASSSVRNFGRSHTLDFNHRTRHSNWSLQYSEQLTTFNQQFTSPLFDSWLCGNDLFIGPLGSAIPLGCKQLTPGDLLILFGPGVFTTSIVNETYLNKSLIGTVSYSLRRNDWRLSIFSHDRSLRTSGGNDQIQGVQASWSFKPSARTTFTLNGGLSQVQATTAARDDDLWNADFTLSHSFQPKLTGNLQIRHQERASNVTGGDYAENSVAARLQMTF